MKKKTLTVAIALVLVVALAVGATYAYLTAKTETVTNTFTVGKTIDDPETNFILKEHKVAYDANTATYKYVDAEGNVTTDSSKYVEVAGNEYNEVTPGMTVAKDPFVQIKKAASTSLLLCFSFSDSSCVFTPKSILTSSVSCSSSPNVRAPPFTYSSLGL